MASIRMTNPISFVKNTRVVYSKWLQRNVNEVQVQFDNEEHAWITYETLMAIKETMAVIDPCLRKKN